MNLAGTAGLSANGNGTDLNGLLGSAGGHNHQQTVKSEPVSPRNRLEDHIRSQVRSWRSVGSLLGRPMGGITKGTTLRERVSKGGVLAD